MTRKELNQRLRDLQRTVDVLDASYRAVPESSAGTKGALLGLLTSNRERLADLLDNLGRLLRESAPHPDGLQAMLASATKGHCFACEAPLKGRRKISCGSEECKTTYMRLYLRDRRERRCES